VKVRALSQRPKQTTIYDCGVFVCKYVDAIMNGMQLQTLVWDPHADVLNFWYRIAWEIMNGAARHMSDSAREDRLLGT
jgi:Ulp1 family protease